MKNVLYPRGQKCIQCPNQDTEFDMVHWKLVHARKCARFLCVQLSYQQVPKMSEGAETKKMS